MVSPCFSERDVDSGGKRSQSATRGSGSTVDVGVGRQAHFLHFEEELFASQADARLSFTFPVVVDVGSATDSAPVIGAGTKRTRVSGAAARASSAAASTAPPEEELDAPAEGKDAGPRPPQFRHVFVFPVAALPACVRGMEKVVGAAAAAAAASSSVPVPAGASTQVAASVSTARKSKATGRPSSRDAK